jgi:hypothetical protein
MLLKKSNPMKTIITFFLCVVLSFSLMATETLTFKFSNPRIIYNAGTNYLAYDIFMKATANGTYLYSSQIICNVNLVNFNTATNPSFIKGFIAGQYESFPNPPADKYLTTANWNSNHLNIAIFANPNLNGNSITSGAYSEVTTNWQVLGTVYAKIINTSGEAGINFLVSAINGYQKYATGVAPFYAEYYSNPNLYEGFDFTNLYLNRIFSGLSGWTQAGGVVDWTASVNTSVWDTTTAAAFVGDVTHPDAFVNGLRIHPAGKLAVNPNTTLTVACNLTNDAGNNGLIIKSNSGGTGSLKQNTDNVPATIQRYITGSSNLAVYKYHFVSVPLMQSENPTSNLFLGSYLFDFNESTGLWNPLGAPTATNLFSNKGYMIYYPGESKTYEFKGRLNNGAFSVPITKNGEGYNLVPNPYPSAIDWDAASGWTKEGIVESAIYIWPSNAGSNANQTNYAVYVNSGSFANGGSRYIAQGQSFFVHATTTPNGFAMNNNVRVHNPVAFFKDDEVIPNILRIKTLANNAMDEMVVRFAGVATTGFDGDWDAYKLVGGADAPQLNSVASDDSKLCINALPFNENETVVPMNFSFSSATNVTLTASGMESFTFLSPIYLEDGLTGSLINLRDNPVYTFSYEPTNDENRFKLHFAKVVGTDEYQESTVGTAYISNGKLFIEVPSMKGQKTEVGVYNLLGQQLDLNRVTMNGMIEVPFALSPGVYVVRVKSSTQVFVSKLVNN